MTSARELFDRLRSGDRAALARAVTIVESEAPRHRPVADALLDLASKARGDSVRVGWTGPPGVGKSTLIGRLGIDLLSDGRRKLAVLAVDPSSLATRGSILGDKSRMAGLANHPRAFVRPSAAGRTLGGVARKTREAVTVFEAAGFDIVFIETVGVGQSETAVHAICDCFVLLTLAGAGDELQGIKRGIVELADMIAVTKADGENRPRAELAAHQARQGVGLLAPGPSGWRPPVLTCSAETGEGLPELWQAVEDFLDQSRANGWFDRRRAQQNVDWMEDLVVEEVVRSRLLAPEILALRDRLEPEVLKGTVTARSAANQILAMLEAR